MKKLLMYFVLFVIFPISCRAPQQEATLTLEVAASPFPATNTSAVSAPTVTLPVERTQPLPNFAEAYISSINMKDEAFGWAWAMDRADKSYLLHTSDGGQTWKNVSPQEDLQMYSYGYSDYELDAQTAWMLLGGERILRTSDGGQTWDVINQNFRAELVWPYPDWYRFGFEDANHGWMRGDITAAGARVSFYETRDGGVTWNPSDMETLPDAYSHQNAMNEIAFWVPTSFIYYDLERMIVVPDEQDGELKMFLSSDRGASWKTVPLAPSPAEPLNLYDRNIHPPVFFDSQKGALVVSIWDGDANASHVSIYGTSDGGQSWSLLGGPATLEGTVIESGSKIQFLSIQDAVVLCGMDLCMTHDSGNAWQKFGFGISLPADKENTYLHISFVDPETGWLLITWYDSQSVWHSRLLVTNDGGVTWTELLPVINP